MLLDGSRVAELEQRIAELTAVVAARDSFIAVAAHELRNPMTPIMGHLDLLMSAVKAGRSSLAEVRQGLERIQHSVRRYVRRADTLLEISRITSGKFQVDLEPLDLSALLREVADDFTGAARSMGVPITLSIPDSLPGTWDRLAMEQIIDNLISNALKYGSRTPIELSAAICGEQVRIQIRDHGCGIPAGDRERVFGQFDRAVGGRAAHGGFGVGLWVVRQLVEAMDGVIAVDDAPGGGALFTMTLPRNVKGVSR